MHASHSLTSLPKKLALGLAIGLAISSCGGEADISASLSAATTHYADGVLASYSASLESAEALEVSIDAFTTNPDEAGLEAARQAWLDARDDYGPTEAFRFYGGPIDDEATGTEGLINAWPLDEGYIDYVEGNPDAGIINDPETFPTIDADALIELNEAGGEANVSTGWHAIEFLLWGQDLDDDGPGDRPVTDYTTGENAERRAAYLATSSQLLTQHLSDLVAAWTPGEDTYRNEFDSLEPTEAMRRIITGIGELSRGELAGERMNVAFEERSQEDEHSCFSDNTTADIVGNARGIEMVLTGNYPGIAAGTGIAEVVAEVDAELSEQLLAEVADSVAAVEAIPAPFDQHLSADVSDDDPGRQQILAGIVALEDQTDTIVAAATALGVAINVS